MSTYTTNSGLELIAIGEQAGTWGTTTNTNWEMTDKLVNGVKSVALSDGTNNLTTVDGDKTSDGLNKVLNFTGSLTAVATVKIGGNDPEQQKLFFVKNSTSGGYAIEFTQGTGGTVGNGRNVQVDNGKTAIVYSDGGGASNAIVAQIETGSEEFDQDVIMKKSGGVSLNLETTATAITDGTSLGRLQFKAPLEAQGGDGALVVATVEGIGRETFDATNNKAKLSLKTADGDAVIERAKVESQNETTKASQITITSGNDTVAQDEIFGRLSFQAPLEAGGGYGALETAMIDAVAEEAYGTSANNTSLVFKTALKTVNSGVPTESFRISALGECGIFADGTATDNNLRVGASGDLKIYHEGGSSKIKHTTGSGHFKLLADSIALNNASEGANLALFTAGGSAKLYYNGAEKLETTTAGVTVTGTLSAGEVTATSDEKLKSEVKTVDDALQKVRGMRGVFYTMDSKKGVGVIAQEIEKILPEVVTDGEKYKSVSYGNIVGVLIEAIKQQDEQIQTFIQELNLVQSELKEIKNADK